GLQVTFAAAPGAANTNDGIHIVPTFAGTATGATYNGLEMDAFSPTDSSGTDTVNGIKLGTLTDPGSAITSTGLNIGSGWDTGISVSSIAAAQSGVNVTGIAVSTPQDSTIGSSVKNGLTLSTGTFSQTTLSATGVYNGVML